MINDLVDNIKLDLNRGRIDVVKYVRIGDTRVHTLHFTLLESGKVYQLDGLLLAEVMIRKPDGNECDQTAIRKGNEIHYTLRTQDYNVLGEARCWLKLTFEDGGEITSPEFSIMVCEDGIPRVREESTNEYTALTQMLAQATQYAEAAAGSAAEAAASVGAITGDVEQAHAYAHAAAESAEEASGYQESVHQEASAAAGYAMEAQTYAGYASANASEAAGYANTASTYASNAESYASNAQDNATAAAGSATQAEASATNASNSASSASDYATAAGNSATNASTSASAAGTSASNAASSATAASGSATAAAGSATSAEAESLEAEGWAKGTQNGTPVESTSPYYHNNSKYYADQASHASGHDILDPSGNVMPGRPNIQFTGGVTVSDDQANSRTIVEVIGSGHTIESESGTYLIQRDTLQFKGATVTDDSTNGKTVVEVTKSTVGLGNVPNVATNDQTPTFTEASTRANIASGEKLSVLFGKIKKFFTDIKTVAFTGSYSDLTGTPTIPNDENVKQTATSTNAAYEVLFSNSSNNTTETSGARKDTGLTFNPSTDTLATKYVDAKVAKALTGTGTDGSDAGASVSPRYTPALWTFNSGISVANGEVYLIKIPVVGGTFGAWLSLDNGANYHPVAVSSSTGKFTSQYAKDTVIAVTYESKSKCNCYARTGSDTSSNVTGCFRVLNDYDSGNNKVGQTATSDNANYEVLFSQTADNTNRTEQTRKNSNLKFNPSTGNLQATQLNGVPIGSSPKFTDSGHTIWNRIKTALTQRSKLWFKDATVSDVSADGASAVEVVTPVTASAFDDLPTDGTADGFYFITDEDEQPLTADDIPYDSTHSVGDMLDDITGETVISSSVMSCDNGTLSGDIKVRNGIAYVHLFLARTDNAALTTITIPASTNFSFGVTTYSDLILTYNGWQSANQIFTPVNFQGRTISVDSKGTTYVAIYVTIPLPRS